jgi:hypothetical protein
MLNNRKRIRAQKIIMGLRYQNQVCHLASMHKKEKAIQLPFETSLGCKIIPTPINTDLLGTFTGEVERTLTPLACVKEKCYRGLDLEKGTLGLANEGSFGPHPAIPFIPADFEVLFFTDRNLGFELTLSKISPQTNFLSQSIQNVDQLSAFAKQALFPSHALILRPQDTKDSNLIFKGIQDHDQLYRIFQKCSEISKDRLVWAETDMRAHMNPSRMKRIEELAYEMANRLATPCPSCQIPGWGLVKTIPGLLCKECQTPTDLIQGKIFGCCQCNYEEMLENQKEMANPADCPFCNP